MVFPHHAYLKANIIDTIPGHKARQIPLTPLKRQQSNRASLHLLHECFSVKITMWKKGHFFPLCTSENKHNPLHVFFFFLIPFQCHFFQTAEWVEKEK